MGRMGAELEELVKANNLQDAANTLQNEANKLQQEMIAETKENNTVTSKHNSRIKWLTIAIVVLTFVTLLLNWNKTGRYAVSSAGRDYAFVIDTKTSQLWVRGPTANVYLGTNEIPKVEITSIESENEQKQ